MQQSPIKQPWTESLTVNSHKFEIITQRTKDETGFITMHTKTQILVDSVPVIMLIDIYADFDVRGDPKIDLFSYDSKRSCGWIDLKTFASLYKIIFENGKKIGQQEENKNSCHFGED